MPAAPVMPCQSASVRLCDPRPQRYNPAIRPLANAQLECLLVVSTTAGAVVSAVFQQPIAAQSHSVQRWQVPRARLYHQSSPSH